VDVSLDNLRLGLRVVRFVAVVVPPLGDLTQLVEEEDALPLGLADGLHDVDDVLLLVLFEFLYEQALVRRQVVGDWPIVHLLCLLELACTLEILALSLQVFDHVVFAGELLVVAEMIDFLVGEQVGGIEDLVGPVAVDPAEVPIVSFGFLPATVA